MLTCVGIDDEPIAISILKEHCRRYGNLSFVGYTTPQEGMEYIKATLPDIVFLDIELNSHNGLELARSLPPQTNLIFTTAYADFALEGFNLDAVDYLHKPIFYPRFEKAIKKAERLMVNPPLPHKDVAMITLKADYKKILVRLDEIILIEAMDNYVKVYRKDKPTIIPQITMKEIEAQLPSDLFVRIHRSYIISRLYVEKFSNRKIYMRDFPRPIPAGRKYLDSYNSLGDTPSSL